MLLDVFTFGYVIASWYTVPYHHELIIFISDNDYCLKLYIATINITILSLLWLFVWHIIFFPFLLIFLSPYIQNVSLNSTELSFVFTQSNNLPLVNSLFTLSVLIYWSLNLQSYYFISICPAYFFPFSFLFYLLDLSSIVIILFIFLLS